MGQASRPPGQAGRLSHCAHRYFASNIPLVVAKSESGGRPSRRYRAMRMSAATAKAMPACSVRLKDSPKNTTPMPASSNTIDTE